MRFLIILSVVIVFAPAAEATDRYFPDIRVSSPSGRFRVDATSPDNKGDQRKVFQSHFTYTCVDTSTKKTLWTRQQAEESPGAIFVSDSGWTVIYTGLNELIVVSIRGEDVGEIHLLQDALTKEENEKYVHFTTGGHWWAGLSAWYFTETSEGEYFVVRPWWGRRVFVDLKKAEVVPKNDALAEAARATETKLVMAALRSKKERGRYELRKREAAYLAGRLKLKQAIPLLRSLEKSKDVGSMTVGGRSAYDQPDNEVDPHSYSTFTDRQAAQLSLRRLGETPASLPCYEFKFVSGRRVQTVHSPGKTNASPARRN